MFVLGTGEGDRKTVWKAKAHPGLWGAAAAAAAGGGDYDGVCFSDLVAGAVIIIVDYTRLGYLALEIRKV
jgi:hypothetical protein